MCDPNERMKKNNVKNREFNRKLLENLWKKGRNQNSDSKPQFERRDFIGKINLFNVDPSPIHPHPSILNKKRCKWLTIVKEHWHILDEANQRWKTKRKTSFYACSLENKTTWISKSFLARTVASFWVHLLQLLPHPISACNYLNSLDFQWN